MFFIVILAFIIPLSLLFWFANVLSYMFNSVQGMTVDYLGGVVYKNIQWTIIHVDLGLE
jgi:hypothetical protein